MTQHNEATILADMFNIVFLVEEVVEEYNLKLPTLNVSNRGSIVNKLKKLPKSEVVQTILDAIGAYDQLQNKLESNVYAY